MKKLKKPTPVKIRKNVRLASLNPGNAPKVRKELLDADYLNKLTEEELLWYAQFTDEWAGGSVAKTKAGKVKSGYLHNTTELAKDCYDRNNRRNNDLLSVTRANRLVSELYDHAYKNDGWYVNNPELQEDYQINNIDKESEILSYEEYQKLKFQMSDEMIIFYESIYIEQD